MRESNVSDQDRKTQNASLSQLKVDLGNHQYPIVIGPGAMQSVDWPHYLVSEQVCVVTNDEIASHYLEQLKSVIGVEPLVVMIEEGEQHKSLTSADQLWSALLEAGFRRNATLIALGGGVIGDLTGFVAATYQRGVPFIQVPTTLLSQVDSSVGGKTAVNHPLGKNMIGAFHQPQLVVADLSTFKTLPKEEFSAGMAEVIKYGLIQDAAFFKHLQNQSEALLEEFKGLQQGAEEAPLMTSIIQRCCELKAQVVQADETEQGKRAILNLGHTFGHAIEAHVGYQGWRHGEAVSVGIRMALDLSWRLGQVPAHVVSDTNVLLDQFHLPVRPPSGMSADHFIEHMKRDKKMNSTQMRLVLLAQLGQAEISDQVPESKLQECLTHFCVTNTH